MSDEELENIFNTGGGAFAPEPIHRSDSLDNNMDGKSDRGD
jgi:hypothetical protein